MAFLLKKEEGDQERYISMGCKLTECLLYNFMDWCNWAVFQDSAMNTTTTTIISCCRRAVFSHSYSDSELYLSITDLV